MWTESQYYTALHSSITLHYTVVLHCITQHYTAQYYAVLHAITLEFGHCELLQ